MIQTLSPLQIAWALSLAVHAGLLTAHFSDPQALNRIFKDTALEVILVNARGSESPTQARAIAQAALSGGGDASHGRATSPLPTTLFEAAGEDIENRTQQRLQALQQQQELLLGQIKGQLAALSPRQDAVASTPNEEREREQKRRQLVKLLAQIERRIQQENERPRKRYVSPATRQAVYAVYYDHLRHAIEDRGTENFPEVQGQKLYGELMMSITVNHDGRVLETRVEKGSGQNALDQRARAIVRSAAPFGRFNRAMRAQADQIVVISRFRFTREATLEAGLSAQ